MGRRKHKKKVSKVEAEDKPEVFGLEHFRVRGNYLDANITTVLPELWPEILQHLSPGDFVSLLNSSPLINKQLQDEKQKRLLPMVLPFMVTGRYVTNPQTFLELRKLYPVTRHAIDSIFEEECSPENYWETITTRDLEWTKWVGDENLKLKRICWKLRPQYDYQFQTKIQRNLEQDPNLLVGAANFNPFLARYLHVKFDYIRHQLEEEYERFYGFMRIYGHFISHLKCSNLRYIHHVFSLLPLIPNLKVLQLYSKENVQDQDEYVRQVHYPDLPHLEFLDLEGFYDHKTDHVNTRLNVAFVRKYGPQLKGLNCNNQFFRGWWGLGPFYCQKLCNIQRLRVAKVGNHALSALREANLPTLQEIHFAESTDRSDPRDQLVLQDVLDVANRFAMKLTCFEFFVTMRLELCRFESLADGSMIPFPNLTTFGTYASNVDFDWFWPFIQHKCPNLVDLNLHGERNRIQIRDIDIAREKADQIMIQRMGFQVAPKLKRITITYGFPWHYHCNAQRVVITRTSIDSKTLWRIKD